MITYIVTVESVVVLMWYNDQNQCIKAMQEPFMQISDWPMFDVRWAFISTKHFSCFLLLLDLLLEDMICFDCSLSVTSPNTASLCPPRWPHQQQSTLALTIYFYLPFNEG